MKLSEQRVEIVKEMLIKKYGIPAEKINIKAEGDTNNRFNDAVLDRCVVIIRK